MNTEFHSPTFGDEVFDLDDNNKTSTTTADIDFVNSFKSSMSTGNVVAHNNNIANSNTSSSYMYQQQQSQQQQQQSLQTKRMINLHNTSDEYHTANEDSFSAATTTTTTPNSVTTTPTPTLAARKQMSPNDTNEPAKPLSAYALFFRDTVSAIKQQNPTCSFQELSKIVASMWDALDPVHKAVYNKKNESARVEYIKQMRVYRQQQEQQQQQQQQQALLNSPESQQQQIMNHSTPIPNATKPAVFTMNLQQQQSLSAVNQQSNETTNPAGEQPNQICNDSGGNVQKCTRDGCSKAAIINPDWEDEYCSNECVVIHCRNVFNDWVKANLEGKQQQPTDQLQSQQQQQQPQATT